VSSPDDERLIPKKTNVLKRELRGLLVLYSAFAVLAAIIATQCARAP
jgi:hypothetical protein